MTQGFTQKRAQRKSVALAVAAVFTWGCNMIVATAVKTRYFSARTLYVRREDVSRARDTVVPLIGCTNDFSFLCAARGYLLIIGFFYALRGNRWKVSVNFAQRMDKLNWRHMLNSDGAPIETDYIPYGDFSPLVLLPQWPWAIDKGEIGLNTILPPHRPA